MEKAFDINPNNPDLMVTKGLELCLAGQSDEGIEWIRQAMDFNKCFPEWYFWHLGIALFAGQRWDQAIDAFVRMDQQNKDTLTCLAASYVQVENLAQAKKVSPNYCAWIPISAWTRSKKPIPASAQLR